MQDHRPPQLSRRTLTQAAALGSAALATGLTGGPARANGKPETTKAKLGFIALTDDVLFLAPEGTNSVLGLSSRGNALITQATAEEKEPFLYAHDARTGDVLGEVKLPGAAFGALMTYRAGGKQYVVVPIGGAGLPAELVAVQVD